MEERHVLESWKEISDYLKRSVSTCQRWEVVLGLPVHRLDGTPSARVFAYPDELDRWMAEKLKHYEAAAGESEAVRPRVNKRPLLIAGGIVILAATGFILKQTLFHPAIVFPATTPCVAFLPLENVTGDPVLEGWRTALPQLISMDLIQSRVVGSWQPGDLFLNLTGLKLWDAQSLSGDDLKRIGEKIGCDHLATGGLIRSGDDIILNLAIHNPKTAETTFSLRTTCRGEKGMFGMVDDLSRKVKAGLNISPRLISHDIDEDVGRITTDSPEAFKLYCEADRLVWSGKAYEASQVFQKAAQLDPEFGEAHYGLFRACRGSLAREEIIRHGEKAIALSDRLNVWSRYQLVGDFYQNFQKDYAKAIAAYDKLFTLMADYLAGYSLAQIYWDLEEFDKAIPILEKIKPRVKNNESLIRLLAICYASSGTFAKAEEVIDEYLNTHSEFTPRILHIRAVYAADQNKFDEAHAFMDKLLSRFPNSANSVRYSKIPITITQDDFPNAEKELQRIVDQGEKTERVYALVVLTGVSLTQGKIEEAKTRARTAIELAKDLGDAGWLKMAHAELAYLERLSGRLPEALAEAEEACRNYQEEGIYDLGSLHLRAMITLEMGRMEEFEKQLAEIKQLTEREQYPKLMRAYYRLLGQRELGSNNVNKAIDYFWKALKLLPSPFGKSNADADSARYFYSLGEAYDKAGEWTDALEMYQKVPPYWEQRFSSGDIYARSFYRMGKLHELTAGAPGVKKELAESRIANAIKSYRKFLSLWGDADALFAAEVDDARQRLATLEAE